MLVPRLYAVYEVDRFIVIEKASLDFWLAWHAEDREDPGRDDTSISLEHLQSLIVVSERENTGTAPNFLNPKRISADGEWEAYYNTH